MRDCSGFASILYMAASVEYPAYCLLSVSPVCQGSGSGITSIASGSIAFVFNMSVRAFASIAMQFVCSPSELGSGIGVRRSAPRSETWA